MIRLGQVDGVDGAFLYLVHVITFKFIQSTLARHLEAHSFPDLPHSLLSFLFFISSSFLFYPSPLLLDPSCECPCTMVRAGGRIVSGCILAGQMWVYLVGHSLQFSTGFPPIPYSFHSSKCSINKAKPNQNKTDKVNFVLLILMSFPP